MWRRARHGHPWDLAQVAILAGVVATLVALLAGLRWGVLAGLVTGLALGAGVVTTYGMLLRRHLVAVRRQARAGILALSSMLEQAAAVDGHPAESEPRED